VYALSPGCTPTQKHTGEPILCCHVIRVTLDGVFGLDIGFIDHLSTQPVRTCNYSATANLHNSQIATAHAKSFPACCVFTSRSLITASNSGDSSASALKSSLKGGSLPTDSFLPRLLYRIYLVVPVVFLINPLNEPSRKHRFKQYLYCRI
jgi:hypothetical protein